MDGPRKGHEGTVRRIHGDPATEDDMKLRQITGQQLYLGLRDYALDQYGLLA